LIHKLAKKNFKSPLNSKGEKWTIKALNPPKSLWEGFLIVRHGGLIRRGGFTCRDEVKVTQNKSLPEAGICSYQNQIKSYQNVSLRACD
jgi:hypothetical protein